MNSLTASWLQSATEFYLEPTRVFADVDTTLSQTGTLRPKTDVFTHDDGRTQLLVCLHGLLPIAFRGATYNIPVALWLPLDYPLSPPITFVVPTSDMLVKPGRFVDVSGRCNLDYIQHWIRKSQGCSLTGLLDAMRDYFSTDPPVFAKPKDQPRISHSHSHSQSQDYASRPAPPIPASSPPQQISGARPPLPPKPLTANSTGSAHSSSPRQSQSPDPSLPNYAPGRNSTILPPPQTMPLDRTVSPAAGWNQIDGRNVYQIPPQLHSISPLASGPTFTSEQQPPYSQTQQPSYSYSHPIPPPPLTGPTTLPHFDPPDLMDEEIPSIPSSQEPPATSAPPPRPLNPETLQLHALVHQKLHGELASLSEAMSVDAERLRAHQSDLLAGEPAIRDEMSRLEAVRDVCRTSASRLRATVAEAETNIAELRRKGDPEVDELVCSTSIVHNQLINLVAEDNAIEDTIYHLHRALNAGRIDLERFLRTSRVLAEEQFMKRALIEKIQNGVPMGVSMGSAWS